MDPINQSDAQAIVEAGKAACKPELVTVTRGSSERVELLVFRDGRGGMQIIDAKPHLDNYLEAPQRREGRAQHTTLDSFIAHVKRFADKDSALFVDDNLSGPKLLCVFDYHRAGADAAPRFGRHTAEYRFPVSDEWKRWTREVGWLEQAEFAHFLEDRAIDVLDPSAIGEATSALLTQLGISRPAGAVKLQSLARGLSLKAEQTVTNQVNLDSGETRLVYDEKHSDESGQELLVPTGFVIAIPVFRHGAHYQIAVRLRYRLKGAVKWTFALCRTEESFRDALGEACAVATKETELPLFYGAPEV